MKLSVQAYIECEGRCLLVRRQNHLRVFGGYTSFVGGKVDAKEKHALMSELQEENLITGHEKALKKALARELKEEIGLELTDVNRLKFLSRKQTPDTFPYRFDSFYYHLDLSSNEKKSLIFDDGEVSEFFWIPPSEWPALFHTGEHLCVRALHDLLPLRDESLKNLIHLKELSYFVLEPLSGFFQYMPLSNTLPPATRTNAFFFEEADLLVDPSPKNEHEFSLLKEALKRNGHHVKRLLITHHHGDHHEMFERFDLPVLASPYTIERLKEKGHLTLNYRPIDEGDVLGLWKNHPIQVMNVPGHDLGQVALHAKDIWLIAGDLFQGIGSVVVAGDHADLKEYAHSLKRCIDQNFQYIVPSHGIMLGGVELLKRTYQHRRLRHQQIMALKHKSVDEIFQLVYEGLSENLHSYAKANIKSHLQYKDLDDLFT